MSALAGSGCLEGYFSGRQGVLMGRVSSGDIDEPLVLEGEFSRVAPFVDVLERLDDLQREIRRLSDRVDRLSSLLSEDGSEATGEELSETDRTSTGSVL